MYHYDAYGLHIRSALPMGGLLPVADERADPDVLVRYGELERPWSGEMETFYFSRSDHRGIYYFVEKIGGLLARDGHEVVVDPLPGPGEGGFHNLVSGIGMGLVLHQRGAFTLHASAVAVDDGVVAFVGWKGMGKSTTAAAFYGSGRRVVTDDLLVVDLDRGSQGPAVVPGFPSLKLWPEAAAAALGDDPTALPRLHPAAEKRARVVRADFDPAPRPLRAVYVLDYAGAGEQLSIEPVSPREACVELVRHSFALRILGNAGVSPAHLSQCAQLARRVPVRRLCRERDLDGLRGIVERVEDDVASLAMPVTDAAPA